MCFLAERTWWTAHFASALLEKWFKICLNGSYSAIVNRIFDLDRKYQPLAPNMKSSKKQVRHFLGLSGVLGTHWSWYRKQQLDRQWIRLLNLGTATLLTLKSLQQMVISLVKGEMPNSFWSGIMGLFVAEWSYALTLLCCSFALNSSCHLSVCRNPFKIQGAYMFTMRWSKCKAIASGTPPSSWIHGALPECQTPHFPTWLDFRNRGFPVELCHCKSVEKVTNRQSHIILAQEKASASSVIWSQETRHFVPFLTSSGTQSQETFTWNLRVSRCSFQANTVLTCHGKAQANIGMCFLAERTLWTAHLVSALLICRFFSKGCTSHPWSGYLCVGQLSGRTGDRPSGAKVWLLRKRYTEPAVKNWKEAGNTDSKSAGGEASNTRSLANCQKYHVLNHLFPVIWKLFGTAPHSSRFQPFKSTRRVRSTVDLSAEVGNRICDLDRKYQHLAANSFVMLGRLTKGLLISSGSKIYKNCKTYQNIKQVRHFLGLSGVLGTHWSWYRKQQLDRQWIRLLNLGTATLLTLKSLQQMVFSLVKWEMPNSFWSGIMGLFVAGWSYALSVLAAALHFLTALAVWAFAGTPSKFKVRTCSL